MNLSDFFNLLKPYCFSWTHTNGEFVSAIINEIIDDPEFDPFSDLQEDSKNRYFSGQRKLPPERATIINAHLDTDKFAAYIENLSGNSQQDICDELLWKYEFEVRPAKLHEVLPEIFQGLIRVAAGGGAFSTSGDIPESIFDSEDHGREKKSDRGQNTQEWQDDRQNLLEYIQSTTNMLVDKTDEIDKIIKEKLEEIKKSPSVSPRLIHNMPPTLKAFTDRVDKIQKIDNQLQQTRWAMVSGMGGIGKTELVKEYINQNKEKYKTVCFLKYDGSLLTTIGLSLPFDRYVAEDCEIENQYEAKMRYLKKYKDDTIIVIDNFNLTKDDSGQYVNAIFDKKFSDIRSREYHIVFTSRSTYDDCIELTEMGRSDQIKLFMKYYTKDISEEDRKTIVEICKKVEGHTITLVLIAKTMAASKRLSLKELLEKISVNLKTNIPERVTHEKDGEIRRDPMYVHIETLFDISQLSEDEKYILLNMTLIPNDGIEAAQFGNWIKLDDFNDFNNLVDTGWIIYDEKSDVTSLHPIISDVIANSLKLNALTCKSYLISLNEYMLELNDGNDWITINRAITLGTSVIGRISDREILVARILYNLGRLYKYLSLYSESNKFLLEALSIYEQKNQDNIDQNELAGLYTWIGLSYSNLIDRKNAESHYRAALDIYEKIEIPDYCGLARTLNLLGSLQKTSAKYEEALNYHKRALEIQTEYLLDNHPDLAETYNYLGLYYNSQSDYEKSLPNFEKSLKIKELTSSVKNKSFAISYNNIASVYSKLGRLNEALEYYVKALEIKKKVLPENHSAVALAYYNIGHIFELKKDLDAAEEYYLIALKIRENLDLVKVPKTAAIYRGLCSVKRKQKRYDEALTYIDLALEIYIDNDMGDLPKITSTYDNKGYVYRDMGRFDDALVYFNKAFDIVRNKLKEPHIKFSNSYYNFADVYMGKKQYEIAIGNYQKALNIRLEKLPENHTKILSIYEKLAVAYQGLDDNDKANEYLGKVGNYNSIEYNTDSEEE